MTPGATDSKTLSAGSKSQKRDSCPLCLAEFDARITGPCIHRPSDSFPPHTPPGPPDPEPGGPASQHHQDAGSLGRADGTRPPSDGEDPQGRLGPCVPFCARHRVELTNEGRCIPCDFGFSAAEVA